MPKEETFHIPLKYTDVTRSTYTDLDVMQEKRVDDYWNVNSNRSLSDSGKGFTKFSLLKEKPLKGKRKTRMEKKKPTLDNARRLRGIDTLDPDDQDNKETLKNARRKLERPMAAAMPCKRKARISKTKVAAEEVAFRKFQNCLCLFSGIS